MSLLPDVASSISLQYAQSMSNTGDFTAAVHAGMAVVDLQFSHPERIPFDIKCAWLGTMLLPSTIVRALYTTRTQDQTSLRELGEKGLPLLVVSGEEDRVVLNDVALAELRACFRDISVEVVQGSGHAVFVDEPEKIVTAVVIFARRIGLMKV